MQGSVQGSVQGMAKTASQADFAGPHFGADPPQAGCGVAGSVAGTAGWMEQVADSTSYHRGDMTLHPDMQQLRHMTLHPCHIQDFFDGRSSRFVAIFFMGWVMSHICMSPVTHMHESCHIYYSVMSHILISHVTHMNTSCHTYG